ncbi:MAG: adenylate/guanylate cyclase domain-containing protein [Gemmatimonadota bacterium]
MTQQVAGGLQAGLEAFERRAWREAFDRLQAVDASEPLEPSHLEQLAEAAWWTGRLQACIDTLERAYAGHVTAGTRRRAAFVAWLLARDYGHKLCPALASGWFSRAERILAEEPEGPEHGYLELAHAGIARGRGDLDDALAHGARACEIGGRFGSRDLQALGLHDQGYVRILQGRVQEGLALLDEATAAAVGGELGPRATAAIYCNTITACRDLADFRRAGEWTEAAKRWCDRQAISGFPGVCRIHRAEVFRLRGAWRDAEAEARRACEELKDFALDVASEGFYEIGEIRLRIGDLAGAAQAFHQADELGREPEPGLSMLRLAEGNVEAAVAGIGRALADESWDRLARARLLPAAVEIALAAGDLAAGETGAAELEQAATTFGTPAFEALALAARAAVHLEREEAGAALPALRRALRLWRELEAPYEAARARMLLGRAFRMQGDEDAARRELQAARGAFERLGAALDARRAGELAGAVAASEAQASLRERGQAARTFMFTDIVGSTSLLEAMGNEAWRDLLRWHDQTLRAIVAEHGGEEVSHTGDGFFVGFRDAGAALDCAVAIQRRLSEHRRTHGFAPQLRIGLHRAEAIRRGVGYGGLGVHAAARIAALADGGEILASDEAVADAGAARYAVTAAREVELKGLREPVSVVAVDWR